MNDWIHLMHDYPFSAVFTWIGILLALDLVGGHISQAIQEWRKK